MIRQRKRQTSQLASSPCVSHVRRAADSRCAKSRVAALAPMKLRLRSRPPRSIRSTFAAPTATAAACFRSWEPRDFRTLGNDFAGTIVAAGKGCEQTFTLGDRVYGVKSVSRDGSHTSHLLVKGAYARKAPPSGNIQDLAVLPYSFVTMWLAAKAAGLTRDNVRGKTVLVHGAAGGLGTLALQTLSAWGAKVTAIAKATDFPACYAAGATEAIDRNQNPFATSGARSTPRSTSPHGTTS